MKASKVSTERSHPDDLVVEWRRQRLLEGGFSIELAESLANAHGTDLHALLDLVDQGCPPALAARILAPLEEEPQC